MPEPSARLLAEARRQDPRASLSTLERGRTLFVAKCSGCHALPLPAEHRDEAWQYWVGAMRKKAGLMPSESSEVLRYLQAAN